MAINLCNGCTTEDISRAATHGCATRETVAVGMVLATVEHNGYDDSDWHALVWNAQTQRVDRVWYASTTSWTYHNNATVDASEDVMRQAVAWLAHLYVLRGTERLTTARSDTRPGRRVRSLTTRGKNKGLTGVLRKLARDAYNRDGLRAGVEVAPGEPLVWMDAHRLEVTDVSPQEIDGLTEHAAQLSMDHLSLMYRDLIRYAAPVPAAA